MNIQSNERNAVQDKNKDNHKLPGLNSGPKHSWLKFYLESNISYMSGGSM